jgi:hypothetical protein
MKGYEEIINNKFSEELIACYPLIQHGPHRKRKNLGGGYTECPLPSNDKGTYGHQGDLISILLFLHNKERRLKMRMCPFSNCIPHIISTKF